MAEPRGMHFRSRFLFEGDKDLSNTEVLEKAREKLGTNLPDFLKLANIGLECFEEDNGEIVRLVVCEIEITKEPPRHFVEQVIEKLERFNVALTYQRGVVQASEDAFVEGSQLDDFSFFDTDYEEDVFYGTATSAV